MTDTDSLVYEIETEDFYQDIKHDISDKFDTSNVPESHPSGLPRLNKKIIGMFEDKCGGKIIRELCGLWAKLYAYTMHEGEIEEKRCKSVKENVVSKSIHFEDYKRCLFSGKEELRRMNVICSRGYELFTEKINKLPLSASYDKRIICEDKINMLAYGHYEHNSGHFFLRKMLGRLPGMDLEDPISLILRIRFSLILGTRW